MNDAPACRACGFHPCAPVLDLGCQPLANNLLRPEDLGQPEPRFPLRLFVCPACWLLQIGDLVPPAKLFCDYLYFSSFSDAMLAHARRAAEQHRREFRLGPQSLVVEIASNDGYLLRNFKDWGIPGKIMVSFLTLRPSSVRFSSTWRWRKRARSSSRLSRWRISSQR